MNNHVIKGRDGLYALMFINNGESEEHLKTKYSKYGEVARVKLVGPKLVFLSFVKEADAQRCLEENSFMKVPDSKDKDDKKSKQNLISPRRSQSDIQSLTSPKPNSVISQCVVRSRVVSSTGTVSTEAVQRIITMPWGQHNVDSENREAYLNSKESKSPLSSLNPSVNGFTLAEMSEKSPTNAKSANISKVTRPTVDLNPYPDQDLHTKSIPDPHQGCSSPPPLVMRCSVEPVQKNVDMLIANFPKDMTREAILDLIFQLKPSVLGDIQWTSSEPWIPYVRVLLPQKAAEILESWNHLLFCGQRLIVAPTQTLIQEGERL